MKNHIQKLIELGNNCQGSRIYGKDKVSIKENLGEIFASQRTYDFRLEQPENTIWGNWERDLVVKKADDIEAALEEYFQKKYNVTGEDICKVLNNTNNFKLKRKFQRIVQGSIEHYTDNGEVFMVVDTKSFSIDKMW